MEDKNDNLSTDSNVWLVTLRGRKDGWSNRFDNKLALSAASLHIKQLLHNLQVKHVITLSIN